MPGLMWPHLRYPRELGAMVDAQVRRWALKRRDRATLQPQTCPLVTIASGTGDQGRTLGRGLAQRLGFSYWDRDLVMDFARLLAEDTAAGSLLDDHTRDAIDDFLGNDHPQHGSALPHYTDQVRLLVDSITRRGGAVVVGQGVQFLVDGRCALRVCLVTPFELHVLQAEGHPLCHPASFDLVVNTETYKRERAVGLVLMAYLAKFSAWPLTARTLRSAPASLPAQPLPPIDRAPSRTQPT